MNSNELVGRAVIGDKGDRIGQVKDVSFDTEAWKVLGLDVELEGSVAGEYGIKKLWRGTTISVDIQHVKAVGDTVVLKISKQQLRSTIGEGKATETETKQDLESPSATL